MFLAYQRASRPYKRLAFDDFTFYLFTFFDNLSVWGLLLGSFHSFYKHCLPDSEEPRGTNRGDSPVSPCLFVALRPCSSPVDPKASHYQLVRRAEGENSTKH